MYPKILIFSNKTELDSIETNRTQKKYRNNSDSIQKARENDNLANNFSRFSTHSLFLWFLT